MWETYKFPIICAIVLLNTATTLRKRSTPRAAVSQDTTNCNQMSRNIAVCLATSMVENRAARSPKPNERSWELPHVWCRELTETAWKAQPPEGPPRGITDLNPGEHPNLARRFDSGHMVHILGDGWNGQSSFQARLAVGRENFLRGNHTPLK